MTGLAVLDVLISLVFIYLLYSLLAMTLIEAITSLFSSRSKNLITGIDRLLADDQQSNRLNHTFLNLFWVKTTNPLTKAFYAHPSIKYLGHKGVNSKPSYIPKDRFSSTLIDLLGNGPYLDEAENIAANVGSIPEFDSSLLESRIHSLEKSQNFRRETRTDELEIEDTGEQLELLKQELSQRMNKENPWDIRGISIGSETKYQLKMLWKTAVGDKEKFKALIENWYEDQIGRVAGWYKRKLTFLTFLFGLIIAGLFNVDSISLTTELVKNDNMRTMLVESAKGYLAENPEGAAPTSFAAQKRYLDSLNEEMNQYSYVLGSKSEKYNIWTFLGWIITAFAISLGAPFWFDLLSKMMQIRNTVSIPANSGSSSGRESEVINIKAVG
jgi:hypothetical protein